MYCLCEFTKTKYSGTGKKKYASERVYNKPMVYMKTLFIVIFFILLIINRFSKQGVIERTSSVKSTVIVYFIFFVFVIFSIYECIRMNKGKGPVLLKKEDKSI